MTPSMTLASFTDRMTVLKQLSQSTGIRLPETIIPEGESLIPYGVERQRALKEEIYSLPTLAEAFQTLRDIRHEQSPKDTKLAIQRVRMSKQGAGVYGQGFEQYPSLGYTQTGFNHVCSFVKPGSVKAGFADTLLALPPSIRADAFNYFATSQTTDKQVVLRSVKSPQVKDGALVLRRTVNAVVSERYTGVEDHDLVADLNAVLPDGARCRYTQTEDRSDLEILWPAMSRELKVGDVALMAIQVTNSQVKACSIRLIPKILRVLCLNFTTAWGTGAEQEVSVRHIGEARERFREAMLKCINVIAPFVHAFGDAYQKPLPEFAPTRGETVLRFLKRFELAPKAGPGIVEVWDADGEKSAGDTLAGLANAVTRYSQTLTIEQADSFERAAGRVISEGWESLA